MEDCTFEYETALSFNRQPGETVWFCSGGIDYLYDIYLNQTKLYSYEGMYRPVELELTPHLTGSDTLREVIHPHPKRPGAAAGTRQEADHSCKPPVCYGWDWNPRLMISGMWQEAYIETRAAEHITACEPFVRLAPNYKTAQVRVEIAGTDRYTVTLQDREGNTVYTGTNPEFTVKNPQLWWCNLQGPTVHFTLPESSEDFITLKLIAENGQEHEYHLLLRHKKPTAKVKQMNA